MTTRRRPLNYIFIAFFASTMLAVPAQAAKLDLLLGGFDLSAKTESGDGSRSGFGSYKLTYLLPLGNHFDVGIGYTLTLANGLSGDAAFGLDVECSYFPFTSQGGTEFRNDQTNVVVNPLWRPFVAALYSQRQFQSVETQFNGFGFGLGVERHLRDRLSLKALARYLGLSGPTEATARELTVLFGVSFAF